MNDSEEYRRLMNLWRAVIMTAYMDLAGGYPFAERREYTWRVRMSAYRFFFERPRALNAICAAAGVVASSVRKHMERVREFAVTLIERYPPLWEHQWKPWPEAEAKKILRHCRIQGAEKLRHPTIVPHVAQCIVYLQRPYANREQTSATADNP